MIEAYSNNFALKYAIVSEHGLNDTEVSVLAKSLTPEEAIGTFDEIRRLTENKGKQLIVYGITAAGVCGLLNFKRWCFQAQNGRGEK